MENDSPFTLVPGGKAENEQRFRELLESPHRFTQEEFEKRVERFRDRLTFEQLTELFIRRIRKYRFRDELERRMLLAAVMGDQAEVDRLTAIHKRRQERGLRVVSNHPTAGDRKEPIEE